MIYKGHFTWYGLFSVEKKDARDRVVSPSLRISDAAAVSDDPRNLSKVKEQ